MWRASLIVALLSIATEAGAVKRWLEESLPPEVAAEKLEEIFAEGRRIVEANKDKPADKRRRPVAVLDVDESLVISQEGIFWDPRLRRIPGSLKLVNRLLDEGWHVIYFTGRKRKLWRRDPTDPQRRLTPRQRTIREMQRLKFPFGPNTELVMNSTTNLRGYYFKKRYAPRLKKRGEVLLIVENEKDIVRMLSEKFPRALAIRINSRAKYPDTKRGNAGIHVMDDLRITKRGPKEPESPPANRRPNPNVRAPAMRPRPGAPRPPPGRPSRTPRA